MKRWVCNKVYSINDELETVKERHKGMQIILSKCTDMTDIEIQEKYKPLCDSIIKLNTDIPKAKKRKIHKDTIAVMKYELNLCKAKIKEAYGIEWYPDMPSTKSEMKLEYEYLTEYIPKLEEELEKFIEKEKYSTNGFSL